MSRFIFFVLFFIFRIIFAQNQMDLDACMRYAVENSYKTARAAIDADNAKKEYTKALLAHFPGINGMMGINSNFGRGIDPETNTYVNTTSFNNSVGVDVGMPIFNGLRYLNQTRSAKIAKMLGAERLRQTRDKVAEETMVAYAEVVYYTELLELYKKSIDNCKTEVRKMERLYETGGGSPADLAQVRAKLASEEYLSIAARNNLEISMIKLKDCMNFPLDDTLRIAPQVEKIELYLENQIPGEIIAFASITNPTAIVGQKEFEFQKRALSIARGLYYPSFSLHGGLGTGYNISTSNNYGPYFTQFKNNLGEYIGVYISVPVFNGLEYRLNVLEAKNNFKRAQYDYDESLRVLSSEIRQALRELEASESQWQQAQINVEYQQIANQANQRKYEAGTLSIIEKQMSDNQLFLSEIELRNAYLRYQIKVREMNYYKGIPYVN